MKPAHGGAPSLNIDRSSLTSRRHAHRATADGRLPIRCIGMINAANNVKTIPLSRFRFFFQIADMKIALDLDHAAYRALGNAERLQHKRR